MRVLFVVAVAGTRSGVQDIRRSVASSVYVTCCMCFRIEVIVQCVCAAGGVEHGKGGVARGEIVKHRTCGVLHYSVLRGWNSS